MPILAEPTRSSSTTSSALCVAGVYSGTTENRQDYDFTKFIIPLGRGPLADLKTLWASNEADNDGYVIRPTAYAYRNAIQTLVQYLAIRPNAPVTRIAPDGEGGVMMHWQRGNNVVRLAHRAKNRQRDYIFYQFGDEYKAIPFNMESLLRNLGDLYS